MKLLAVDDSKDNLDLLKIFLSRDNHFEVTLCESSKEVLELYKQGKKFDVVLSDFNLPECDGKELLERIKKIDGQVTGILTSGDINLDWVQLGFAGFLPKPIRFKTLAPDILEIVEQSADHNS